MICRHNKPVAELRAVESVRTEPRPIGPLPGRPTFDIPRAFFDPLPQEELDLWEGVAADDPLSLTWPPRSRSRASKAAESKGGRRAVGGRRVVRRRS